MKQASEIGRSAKSANKVQIKASKLSSQYWVTRVYQPYGREFWVQMQHAGQRHAFSLGTSDRRAAGAKAAGIYERIRNEGWNAGLCVADPERHASKHATLTVGTVVETLERVDLKPRTRDNYAHGLRWWAAQHLELKPGPKEFARRSEEYRSKLHAVTLSVLSLQRLGEIRDRFIRNAGEAAVESRRARISVKSFARNARAGIRAAERLGHLPIPSPRPFEGLVVSGAVISTYRSEIDPAELLKQAVQTLQGNNPKAVAVLLLALGAGLRRGEIQNLRWAAVDRSRLQIRVEASGTWQAKNAQSEAAVDVDAGLIEALGVAGNPDEFVVDPESIERAVKWLRGQGIKSPKPLHALRKEFGSIVCQTADLLTASRQLRHSSLAVTAGVYVENRRKASPAIGAMLAGGAK